MIDKFIQILKDSQFSHKANTLSCEYKHNRLNKKAIVTKDMVYISSYTSNTNRYLGTERFDSPDVLINYLDKNQIV